MKKVSEEVIKTLTCKVVTKPSPHPFHIGVDDELDYNLVSEYIRKKYTENMAPIINACDTEELKNQIRRNIDNAKFEDIKFIETKNTIYELE